MKLTLLCIGLAAASASASAQGDTRTTRTSGACSPVVTGGSTQITIHCSGMSNETANKVVLLMNKILAQHLDLNQVNSKLNELGSQLGDINTALNPLSGAPIEVVKLYEEGQELARTCQSLMMEWSRLLLEATQGQIRQQRDDAAASAASASAYMNAHVDIENKREAEYRATLMPRLFAWDSRVRALMQMSPAKSDEYTEVRSYRSISIYTGEIEHLEAFYEANRKRLGAPIDPSIQEVARKLVKDCQSFAQAWQNEAATPYANRTLAFQASSQNPVDLAEAQKYHATLEPQLVIWRRRALAYLPNYSSYVGYSNVKTSANLIEIYSDLLQMQTAYQQKRQNETLEKRTTPADK